MVARPSFGHTASSVSRSHSGQILNGHPPGKNLYVRGYVTRNQCTRAAQGSGPTARGAPRRPIRRSDGTLNIAWHASRRCRPSCSDLRDRNSAARRGRIRPHPSTVHVSRHLEPWAPQRSGTPPPRRAVMCYAAWRTSAPSSRLPGAGPTPHFSRETSRAGAVLGSRARGGSKALGLRCPATRHTRSSL